MTLCFFSPHLINCEWVVELVNRLGGNVTNSGWTALIWLFYRNPEKTDFGSQGFKLLWEKEKDINVNVLQKYMHSKKDLKNIMI